MARPGSVGFISQSGALCTAILDWSLKENVGFSAFVSLGSMLDVSWGDLIHHLGDDPNTKSIVIYMETIGDARAFLSAAREVALTKPIIVIKPGRTAAAAKAAASHTGSLTGSDEVLQAAFQRVGVLRVEAISELFDMAEVLAKQPRPNGPRLTIVTNAGGPSVMATDMLISTGAQLAELTPETMEAFNAMLPPTWSHNNPVDIIGDAKPELYAKSVEIAAKDPNTDGIAGHSHAAGHDRSHRHCGMPEALCPYRRASPSSPAGWAPARWPRARTSSTPPNPHVQVSRPRGAGVLLHVALQREFARALRDPAPCRRATTGRSTARRRRPSSRRSARPAARF